MFWYSKVLTKDIKNDNMTIRYEANPPKVLPDVDTDESIRKFIERIKKISKKCDAIHLTENVLGFQRVSPIKEVSGSIGCGNRSINQLSVST